MHEAQEIQFWEFMGESNLVQYQELSLSVVLVSLFCDNKGRLRTVSRRKSYLIIILLWVLEDFLLPQLLLFTKNLASGELKAKSSALWL